MEEATVDLIRLEDEKPFLPEVFSFRPLSAADRSELGALIHTSFNTWYAAHNWEGDYFKCSTEEVGIFLDIYGEMDCSSSVAAIDSATGRIAGACFYHHHENHMSLGIMAVHPDYWDRGVGKGLVHYILKYAQDHDVPAVRLVGSAANVDSFSLYNRAGFVPREKYNDMVVPVPDEGLQVIYPGMDRVRPATLDDVPAIAALEREISGIERSPDYAYCMEHPEHGLNACVLEGEDGAVTGFLASLKNPALNMLGPGFARSETDMLALIIRELNRYRGEGCLVLAAMEQRVMVEQLYNWGGRNVETHLLQVHGAFQEIRGVSLPSFLPETG